MAELPTNYLDDILAASMNGKRKYRITHSNGLFEEVTIEDVSEYDQIGSNFGAGDINRTNQEVNKKFDSEDVVDPMLTTEEGFAADAFLTGKALKEQEDNLTASNGMPFKFGINENGEYGYIVTDSEGADAFSPFKKIPDGYSPARMLKGVLKNQSINGGGATWVGETDVTINFDPPFNKTPVNFVMWRGTEEQKYFENEKCTCITMKIEPSYATIRIRSRIHYNEIADFCWEAIGFYE